MDEKVISCLCMYISRREKNLIKKFTFRVEVKALGCAIMTRKGISLLLLKIVCHSLLENLIFFCHQVFKQ